MGKQVVAARVMSADYRGKVNANYSGALHGWLLYSCSLMGGVAAMAR
jgi:hypothetical protein